MTESYTMNSTRGKAVKKRRLQPPVDLDEQLALIAEEEDTWWIGVDAAARAIRREFLGPYKKLSDFALCPIGPSSFWAYLLFTSDKAIHAAKKTGLIDQIIDDIYLQLGRRGRGRREEITLTHFVESRESLKRRGMSSLNDWMR
jgi:hypothetical protein